MNTQNHERRNKKIIAGEGEKAQYLVHKQNDNTVRFALRYPGKISQELLEQAVKSVVDGIDILHASFIPDALEGHWVVHEAVAKEDYFTLLETEKDTMAIADEVLLKPMLPEGKAQMHCTLIQSEKDCALVVRISHFCVDGGDGKYLLKKLIESYNLLVKEGTTEKLELKNGSRSVFQIYKGMSFKECVTAAKASVSSEETVFPFPEKEVGYPHLVRRTINPVLMQKVRQYGKAENATINDVLLTAYSRAYHRLPGVDKQRPVNIMSMMDLRRYCKDGDSEGLTNIVGSMSTVVEIKDGERFEETLQKIAAQTKSAKESPIAGLNGLPAIQKAVKIAPLGMAVKVADKLYSEKLPIGMTNLGNFSGDELTLGEVRPTEFVFGGPAKKKNGMQISAAGLDGVVTLCCVGEYGDKDAELITQFLEWMEEELREAVGK